MEAAVAEIRNRLELMEGRVATREREHATLHNEVNTVIGKINDTVTAQGRDLA